MKTATTGETETAKVAAPVAEMANDEAKEAAVAAEAEPAAEGEVAVVLGAAAAADENLIANLVTTKRKTRTPDATNAQFWGQAAQVHLWYLVGRYYTVTLVVTICFKKENIPTTMQDS